MSDRTVSITEYWKRLSEWTSVIYHAASLSTISEKDCYIESLDEVRELFDIEKGCEMPELLSQIEKVFYKPSVYIWALRDILFEYCEILSNDFLKTLINQCILDLNFLLLHVNEANQ